jgi:fructokinase
MNPTISIPDGDIDLLAVGETLIDFISEQKVARLRDAESFRRYLGGSPANIAVNVAKLGGRSAVISKIGADAFGQFIESELRRFGVSTDYLVVAEGVRTSIVFVARTTGTPDFEALRAGDYQLAPEEVMETAIARAKVVHASTFALSREPCRSAVRRAFTLAHERGKLISLDPNYSPQIWPDAGEARQVLAGLYRMTTLTKPSIDDARRLFGPTCTPEQGIARFHEMGARIVIFTMGRAGVLISEDGRLLGHLPARQVAAADATGAGDSFWAGFITALLDGNSLGRSVLFGREVVERKLQTVGPLPFAIDRSEVYAALPAAPPPLNTAQLPAAPPMTIFNSVRGLSQIV